MIPDGVMELGFSSWFLMVASSFLMPESCLYVNSLMRNGSCKKICPEFAEKAGYIRGVEMTIFPPVVTL